MITKTERIESMLKFLKWKIETWKYIPSHKNNKQLSSDKKNIYVSSENFNLIKFTNKYPNVNTYLHKKYYPSLKSK